MQRLKNNFPDDFDFELVAWCEVDAAAIKAHDALFPQWKDRNLGDITKVNPADVPDCDCITWSFPCQAISTAGQQKGMKSGSGTTSSLAWECIKIFKAKRPKYLLMENVAAITHRQFKSDFAELRETIAQLGYRNYYQLLNAKDYGVPQNRLRCFMVSVRDDGDNPSYTFPEPINSTVDSKDVRALLEPAEDVDESQYIATLRVTEDSLLEILEQPGVYEQLLQVYYMENNR
jgi:DNA (cytosine-5)-methyltransferase 1